MPGPRRAVGSLFRLGWPLLLVVFLFVRSGAAGAGPVVLAPPDTARGYVARLLINEVPFPGERFWVSEQDSRAAQAAIIWVLRHRLSDIPPGYRQSEIAAVTTRDVIDLLTAGGEHGQVEGFFRDPRGVPAVSQRVTERIDYLVSVANRGTPGRFARLLEHAQLLANDFVSRSPTDRYADLREVDAIPVTGCAYGWMTDRDVFRPGGNFVRISDQFRGSLGGNRFFTLRRLDQ